MTKVNPNTFWFVKVTLAIAIIFSGVTISSAQNTPPSITTQPPANMSLPVGGSGTITVAASGTAPLSYQWQASNPIGYANISNGGSYSGVNTPTLTLSNVGELLSTTIFRCVVTNAAGSVTSSGTWLTVLSSPPSFTVQPPAQTPAIAGQSVTISATATGIPTPTYQWERGGVPLTNGGNYSGVTTATLTIIGVTQAMNGDKFRCRASNGIGFGVISTESTLVVSTITAPTITTQPPANMSLSVGGSGTITIAASGTAPLAYQWQASNPIGYANISNGGSYSGVNTPTLTLSNVGELLSTTIFRCVVTNAAGSVTSSGTWLTVLSSPPSFTVQPPAQTPAIAGQSVTISATANGIPTPTYQWERGGVPLTNGGSYSGVTTATLTISGVTQAMNGDKFRCRASNGIGLGVISAESTLSVSTVTAPAITTQPPAHMSLPVGGSGTITIAASGTAPLSYQWQASNPIGFANISNGGSYSGVNTPTLTLTNVGELLSTTIFRCVVTNAAGSVTSSGTWLTVLSSPPSFTVQPPAQTPAIAGQSVTISATANGIPTPTYQWERSVQGGAFAPLTNGAPFSGVTTSTLTISGVTQSLSGDRFRCRAVNGVGLGAVSNESTLSLSAVPVPNFTQQPTNVTAAPGESGTFSVVVTGDPTPIISWQSSTTSGATWQPIPGANGPTFTIASLSLSDNGRQFRAVATNSLGGTRTSSAALLSVSDQATVISVQPIGGTYRSGQSVTLNVVATGTGVLQYQWFKDGQPVFSGTPSYTISSLEDASAGGYYVEVAGSGGKSTSQVAMIQVQSLPRFVLQPANGTVETGLNVAFNVVVLGSPQPTLQWYARTGTSSFAPVADGGGFTGATQSVLRISAAAASLDGLQVQARASNAVGTAESAIATLRVAQPTAVLKFKTQPQSQTVKAGEPFRFFVEMEGSPQVTLQWRKEGAAIDGAFSPAYALSSAKAADAGGYSVVARDASGNIVTSNTAALTVVGGLDGDFDPKAGTNAAVTLMIRLSDGGYLVSGTFTRVAGVPRAGLAKIRADGTLAPEFDPGLGASGVPRVLLELAAGKFLMVGQFDRFNGVAVPGVVRLASDGRIDPTFVPVLPPAVAGDPIPALERFHFTAIALSNGSYLLGGQAGVVALSSSGGTVAGSVHNSNSAVFALLQQYNSGIIVGGDFTAFGGGARPRLARLTANLLPDPAFNVGSGPNSTVQSLLRSPEGWIYVFGTFTSFNGQPRIGGVARISPTGSLDLTYNPPLAPLATVAAESSDNISEPPRLAAGSAGARKIGVVQPNASIAVLNTAKAGAIETVTSIDPSTAAVSNVFNVAVEGAVNALAVNERGAVALAGDFTSVAGADRANLAVVTDDTGASRVVNLATRGRVAGGDRNLFLGFVIKGPESMRVLIRGVGPTLREFGISDPLAVPLLTVFDAGNRIVAENRSWRAVPDPTVIAQLMTQVGAFPLGTNGNDTALLLNLAPGSYTAQISGEAGAAGVALGEVYAVDHGQSRLINLSVRGQVGTGDDILIPAFVVAGGSRMLLMRTVGPGLGQFNVSDTLARPMMELRRNGAVLETNEGWRNSFDPAAIEARSPLVGAFPLNPQSADSALLKALAPGSYAIHASGANGGTGVALIEIYDANGIDSVPGR